VGLELHLARRGGEAGPGRRIAVQPVGQQARLLVADLADGLIAGVQAAELGQVAGGAGERPAGAGQRQQLAGLGADEPRDPPALIERVARLAAAGAGEIPAAQADGAGDGQDVAAGRPFVPEAASAATAPARRPFFSAASAWACRVAWTAWRASSRAAATARAS